jgi:ADP-ribosyl-[dinitrogen reductase] hydrolase
MRRFVAWWQEGEYTPVGRCFDIGGATAAALGRFQRTGDPLAGSTSEQEAGNGSLMRLAPVPIFAHQDSEFCRTLAAQQSRTTHGAPQAADACVFFADLLRRAIQGEAKQTLLAPQGIAAHEQVRIVAAGGWQGMHRDQIRSTGYVVDTLEAALWAVSQTHCYRDAVILAVNLADDADTVGAVTGQLAGAIYGMSSIPARWLEKLAWKDRLLACADNLLNLGMGRTMMS